MATPPHLQRKEGLVGNYLWLSHKNEIIGGSNDNDCEEEDGAFYHELRVNETWKLEDPTYTFV